LGLRKDIINKTSSIDKFRAEMVAQVERGEFDELLLSQADVGMDTWCCSNCVAEGSFVALADGTSLPIEEVVAGDLVLSYRAPGDTGTETGSSTEGLVPRSVSAVLDQGLKQCVELLFSDGRTLTCTPDHRIRTADGRWVEAGQLLIGTDEVAVGVEYACTTRRSAQGDSAYGVHHAATVLPLFRVRLVGRRDVGQKHVYDLTVPSEQGDDTASFTANGIVCHNCKTDGKREQSHCLGCGSCKLHGEYECKACKQPTK